MVVNISLKQLTDLNGDGKINNIDRHISAGKGDSNNDGKIDSDDFFFVRGVKEDLTGDGKINWQDIFALRLEKQGKSYLEADTNGDGKVSSAEYQAARFGIDKDYNGDGKINWLDNAAKRRIDKLGVENYLELDKNNDGKFDRQDILIEQGYKDVNFDGKVTEEDKIYKDTYGDINFGSMRSHIQNINFDAVKEKTTISEPVKQDNQQNNNIKYNLLNSALTILAFIQKALGINVNDYSSKLTGINGQIQLGDTSIAQNQFTTNELAFLLGQGAFRYSS